MSSSLLPNIAISTNPAHELNIAEAPTPSPAAGECLVHVRATGICGSDVHFWKHGGIGSSKVTCELGLGHESAGEVVGLGEGVEGAGWKVGEFFFLGLAFFPFWFRLKGEIDRMLPVTLTRRGKEREELSGIEIIDENEIPKAAKPVRCLNMHMHFLLHTYLTIDPPRKELQGETRKMPPLTSDRRRSSGPRKRHPLLEAILHGLPHRTLSRLSRHGVLLLAASARHAATLPRTPSGMAAQAAGQHDL